MGARVYKNPENLIVLLRDSSLVWKRSRLWKMADIEVATSNPQQPFSAFALQTPAMATLFSNENNLADLLGQSSNHIDDLFKELEDWEAVLSSLPDFGVDLNSESSTPDEIERPEP